MSHPRVLIIASLANPTCTNWIYGLKSLGYNVAVLDWRKSPATQSELENWGFKEENKIPIINIWDDFPLEKQQEVEKCLGGLPDALFSWEGALILKPLLRVKRIYTIAKVIHRINSYPSALNEFTEFRLNWRYQNANPLIDGYIFYSETQRHLFLKKIPTAANKPYLVMVAPFFKKAFSSNNIQDYTVPKLERFDGNPHIIFTGNSRELWNNNFLQNQHRDALGKFFKQLAKCNVHIFIHPQGNTRNISNLHLYPDFSNEDIFTGRFAQYISQFDAHLVMYNEYNSTIRRWVSSGLSTRFAYALTSTTPLAVTKTSKFVEEHWKGTPFGFTFSDIDNLAKSLHNKQMLALLRRNLEKIHISYAFEYQSHHVAQFFNKILQKSAIL
ncbi:hypothetical protein ACE1AT_06075 [Pelatocladus sp. BLCC-F211]|uniref:hypothetical protein n=1 Tax=Pelatocladus sp. BLCC-F211 TaxID=3342752 RepID=UPI0035B83A23